MRRERGRRLSERRSQYVIAGNEYSREEVIHRYVHLVKYVAGRVSVNLPPNVELNDLISDGVIGLIDAIEKYDDQRGVKFETYAITRWNKPGLSFSDSDRCAGPYVVAPIILPCDSSARKAVSSGA